MARRITVQQSSGCWLRNGYQRKSGYGVIGFGKKRLLTHRVAWSIHTNTDSIPEHLCLDHLCKTRNCCNPMHLRLGTRTQNTPDNSNSIQAANKAKTHCAKGHPFDETNTRWRHSARRKNPSRECRMCKRLARHGL